VRRTQCPELRLAHATQSRVHVHAGPPVIHPPPLYTGGGCSCTQLRRAHGTAATPADSLPPPPGSMHRDNQEAAHAVGHLADTDGEPALQPIRVNLHGSARAAGLDCLRGDQAPMVRQRSHVLLVCGGRHEGWQRARAFRRPRPFRPAPRDVHCALVHHNNAAMWAELNTGAQTALLRGPTEGLHGC
jgi:hypothetical protein